MHTVLYVDDEMALLDVGKVFLERSGQFQIDTANSVEEALVKIRQQHYDGIISDYQMPIQDGIDFLHDLRVHYPDLPFILFTGRGREEIAIEALNSGADFYVQKGGEMKSQFVDLEHKLNSAINRKRMNDDLLESRQRMTGLINSLPDATFAIDKDNRVIAWNKTLEVLTGIPSSAILGTSDYTHVLSTYNEKRPPLVDLILKKDPVLEKKYPGLNHDGDKFIAELFSPAIFQGKGAHLWLIASPLYDASGKVIGAIESIRDITDRKDAEDKLRRTHEELNAAYEQLTATEEELRQNYDELSKSQEELRETKERYEDVVEDQTEFICRFSPDGILTFVNDAYCRYFELKRDECLGLPQQVIMPGEDKQLMKQQLASLTREAPVAAIEHRIIMPSGETRWQRWNDRAIFDTRGNIREYQSVGRDITAYKDAEEKLRRTHEELNAAYEQLTATEEELRQNYDELSKSQVELRETKERYEDVVEDQTEFICRFSPDGSHRFVNGAYCRYFGKQRDEIIGKHFIPDIPKEDLPRIRAHFAAITQDHPVHTIEHRIRMPDGEIRWQQWSDRAIFDTTGTVTEYQSVGRDITDRRRADHALHEANKKLNLLSGITRHDILNQLTALQAYLDFIDEKNTDPEVKTLLKKAVKTGKVIQSQISFTQMYQDIGIEDPGWQNICVAARSACRDGRFQNVTIDALLTGMDIFSDPLFKMVLHNLFENAVMHGKKDIRIHVSGEMTPSGFVLVIEDDGKGIPYTDKEKIFEKGFGTHTGLGLFFVAEVLAMTGMTIRETGEPGKGARFEIHIPKGIFRKVS
ncbi:MAG: PAS domain S-box protein [Methanoregula sp.]